MPAVKFRTRCGDTYDLPARKVGQKKRLDLIMVDEEKDKAFDEKCKGCKHSFDGTMINIKKGKVKTRTVKMCTFRKIQE